MNGLNTDAEKQRAIYAFVSNKFRYISVSLGEGRYQPHSADEVLTNQYGDCKDKHTLFSALLKAAGIASWPVLIGAGIDLDPEVPSPAQFNHVITYIPGNAAATWLDTTPEVAPYGLLQPILRDKKALVIPDNGTASIMTTPDTLPFQADMTVDVKAKLNSEGTLAGHFEITARGDEEVALKSAFHATAPAQWTQLAQNLAQAMGYAGTVSSVAVDNPLNAAAPFHYTYSYERKTYADWGNRRITVPIPPIGIEGGAEMEKPTEAIPLGAIGKLTYRGAVELPEGYSVALPADVKLTTDFADYNASYSVDQGILKGERVLIRKKSKIPVNNWEEYRTFAKAVLDDEDQFIQLARSGGRVTVTRDNEAAGEWVQKAAQALQNSDLNTARDALSRAEELNPQQTGLWAAYGMYYGRQNHFDKAIDALQKELDEHPGNVVFYPLLVEAQRQLGRKDDVVRTLRNWVQAAPENIDATLSLSTALIANKQFTEAAGILETSLKANPDDIRLQRRLLDADLRGGKKSEGLSLLAKIQDQKLDPETQNDLAWSLADTNTESSEAVDIAQKAVAGWEEKIKQAHLSPVRGEDLSAVSSLGATWDTLGWAYFRTGDLVRAKKFLEAAWVLLQSAAVSDHIAQLYERQGKKAEAIHAYRLALAVQHDMPETRERLEALGGVVDDKPTLKRGAPRAAATVSAEDELSEMRSVPVPGLVQRDGNAEFFVLLSPKGVLDTQFIEGDDKFKTAGNISFEDLLQAPIPRRWS